MSCVTQLVNGDFWWYLNPNPLTIDEATQILNSVNNFQVSGYPGNWKGEGFNKILRQTLTLKMTPAGAINFFASH